MFGNSRLVLQIVVALALTIAASTTQAQWLPQWSTIWQLPEPFHGVAPLRVRVATDGAVFAAGGATSDGLSYVALSRFNPDGSFAWTREGTGYLVGGMALMDGDRVAITGRSDGVAANIYIRVYDTLTGDLAWQRDAVVGYTFADDRFDTEQLAIDMSGNLMVVATDDQDYVVIRFDANGNVLPTWRHAIGPSDGVQTYGIVGFPDGGAVVSGQGGFTHGGYITVRFDSQGNVVFTDIDLGGIANPLGPSFVALGADGNIVVASSPEGPSVPRAQVWKLSPTGARLWTKVLPDPDPWFSSMVTQELLLAANGDPLISVLAPTGSLRLVRLAAASGEVLWDVRAPIDVYPRDMALATNGRVLIGGYGVIAGDPNTYSRIVEFDANGDPCRIVAPDDPGYFVEVGGGSAGWRVLDTKPSVTGIGFDTLMSHYDADGPCTLSDQIFTDNFDGAILP